MPNLSTTLHLDMLKERRYRRLLPMRLFRALKREFTWGHLYGLEWGDPELVEPLRYIRDQFVRPYVKREHKAVEIGLGGGRWTRYLLGFGTLYAVDYYEDLIDEHKRNFGRRRNIVYIKNNGTDFPGIPPHSIDYVFTFGTFVHLDFELIDSYLKNLRDIVKPGANIVIQYSDMNKIMARKNKGFSENTPERMREAVIRHGYTILEEDTTTLWHSAVVRFTI